MTYLDDKPAGLCEIKEGIVEVKIWEAFLLYNRNNLYNTLFTYSLNNGPEADNEHDLGIITFRFTTWDWRNTLKKLLNTHNIPVVSEVTLLEVEKYVRHM